MAIGSASSPSADATPAHVPQTVCGGFCCVAGATARSELLLRFTSNPEQESWDTGAQKKAAIDQIEIEEVLVRFRDRFIGAIVGGALVIAVVLAPTVAGASSSHASRAPQEDFMFQVMHFHTADQGGDTFNFYLDYRYRDGLPTSQYPNFVAIRRMLLNYMRPKRSQYVEILNTHICTKIKNSFPIQAISCQFQVYNGVDPGYRSSIVTIGDIQPLAIPKP